MLWQNLNMQRHIPSSPNLWKSFPFCQLSLSFDILTFTLDLVSPWQVAKFQNYGSSITTKDQTKLANNFSNPLGYVSTFTKCNSAFSMFFTLFMVIDFYWKHLLGENSLNCPQILKREEIKCSILNIYHRMISSRPWI